ncbi:MAG TPA: hypothetical protein VHM69_10450 [Rubrobacter sp.]|nr:hypothetical protein [Rubrobacter sp.]
MSEHGSISGVWREALAIIRCYPSAVLVPGAVLGAVAEAPAYFIADRILLEQLLTYLAAAFAYYLYLAYAEGITTDYEHGEDLIVSRGRLARFFEAATFVPRVLVAALVTVSLASAATGLLMVPGMWLYTRWSLSVPVICKEDMRPVASLKRSSALVRGRFWFVLGTATLAFVSEEAVIHVGALATGSITGSHTWGEWVGGSIVAALAIPLAALTTSVAYSRVVKLSGPVEGS